MLRAVRNVLEGAVHLCGDLTGVEPVRLKQSARGGRVIQSMAALAGPVGSVIDVGASDGRWTDSVRSLWPDAHYVLVEAQSVHFDALDRYARAHPRTHVVKAAASDHAGTIHFNAANPFGGEACETAFAAHDVTLPCTTLEQEVLSRSLPGPYVIKLDTHGHEREILHGAERLVASAALIVIEAYNFAKPNRMFFWQLCELMVERGFRVASLADPLLAPDGVLRQMDLCFLPKDNKGFDRIE